MAELINMHTSCSLKKSVSVVWRERTKRETPVWRETTCETLAWNPWMAPTSLNKPCFVRFALNLHRTEAWTMVNEGSQKELQQVDFLFFPWRKETSKPTTMYTFSLIIFRTAQKISWREETQTSQQSCFVWIAFQDCFLNPLAWTQSLIARVLATLWVSDLNEAIFSTGTQNPLVSCVTLERKKSSEHTSNLDLTNTL